MESDYHVFSSDWFVRVQAASSYDAVLKATNAKYKDLGTSFSIAHIVAVVNEKGDFRSYDSVVVLEDLGHYYLASQLKIYLNNRK